MGVRSGFARLGREEGGGEATPQEAGATEGGEQTKDVEAVTEGADAAAAVQGEGADEPQRTRGCRPWLGLLVCAALLLAAYTLTNLG